MRGRAPLILRRAFNEPLLLLAAFGSILLATTTLVALTLYASTIADVGVRRAMATASVHDVSATVTAPVTGEALPALDRAVREALTRAYPGVPTAVTLSSRSDSYAMPGQEDRETPELTRFAVQSDLQRQARLQSGAWPAGSPPASPGESPGESSAGGVLEAALSQPAARAMGLAAGSEITVVGRLDDDPVKVRITGVYTLDDPLSDRWAADPLLTRGVETKGFTTYGPLMVGEAAFRARFVTNVPVTWTAVPDLRTLSPERLRPLAASVAALTTAVPELPGCAQCTVAGDLPGMLARLGTAGLVARSTMLVPVLQLLLLASYALTLTARLLADHRRMEVALLRSRGAGSVRLALLAGGEALLVALPCVIIAPLLAAPLLRFVGSIPWIAASGVRLAPGVGAASFLVAAAVALACAVLLALPALRGARLSYMEEQSARGRGDRRGLFQRAGADVALLVVAALAIWQLQRYGAPVTATVGGDLGLDPLIITGPALALLCGGVLGLRLVSPVSRLAERFTARRPSLAPALGAWQVSRRPLRYSGPALLLIMAVAIGVVSMTTAVTWRGSQDDQARHQAGADLRVAGSTDGQELGSLGRGPAYVGLPGVESFSPAYHGVSEFGGDDATLLALDADRLGALVKLRPDLSAEPLGTLARRLSAARPPTRGLPLPGEPRRLTLDLRLTAEGATGAPGRMPIHMVVVDALGVRKEIPLGSPRSGASEMSVDLSALAGRSGRLAYPLAVSAFSADVAAPPGGGLRLTVERVRTDDGTLVPMPAGVRWAQPPSAAGAPRVTVGGDGALFGLEVTAPQTRDGRADPRRVTFLAVPAETSDADLFGERALAAPLPVVVTGELAAAEKLVTGQTATVTLDQTPVPISVAGVVGALPGTPADRPALLVDWETLQARDLAAGRAPRPATEWWLGLRGGESAAAVAELGRHPEWDQSVVDLASLTRQLRDDPLASGLQGALILGFVAALIFALLGFLVNAAVAARERAAEFAVLRALGMSARQVLGMLAVEQAFLIGLSLAAGTALAVVVARLVVPHIVLTGQATTVTPAVLLDIPWLATAGLLAVVALLLFAIVAALARTLRGTGPGGTLRIGEDA
ncbi:hypothetical protein Misp01_37170 [Microtetraspora sp. NBRC 13810]|uniref:FtsX-like permease family protein n=1 Tax=Microtetraspora sp. NBRC 13810 TaxID=3030990 RepID=UPI0024A48C9E|nr:FtsX-like permease family protein [Microtetraspora sp. NBRC 13810]GLW08587.1 hypothetical protein Misp01_37170 [Microtetraspora sp. NBRC 13810]